MKTKRQRVVITGAGILSSLADNIDDFKQALLEKKCAVTKSERFSVWFENARAAEIRQPVDYAGLEKETINLLDNAALWAYKVGKDALTQSGLLNNQPVLDATGLIVGVSSAGTEAFLPLFEQRLDEFSLMKAIYSGGFSSCCASIASLLRLKGGVELVATACTASTNALGMAFDYIQGRKSKTMLVVGTEPIYLPTFAGFYALNVMHPQSCTPFSGSSGMSIGEGAGALVLEEYEHALARGANIYGEVLSYATSCDAYHETGPDPRGNGAVQAMMKALENADVKPEQIDYINAHGTGTEANDRVETLAMKKVFANAKDLLVSSTKSYVGHNIGAAGIVELIACLVTLPASQVLPTLNFSTARSGCDLDYVPNRFAEKEINLFMKNNYAFGGNNCSLILSTRPALVPATTYTEKRVAIVGIGAVSAIGHTYNEILEFIWQENKTAALSPVTFPPDILAEAQALITVLINTGQLSTTPARPEGFNTFQVTQLEPRKHIRRYDPRKATRGGTFAMIALSEALRSAKRRIKRDGENLGLVMGMSRGPQATTCRYLQSLKSDPSKVRTSEFPGSLMNSVATFCGISEGIKGYTTTLATGENAALGALTYGYEMVRQNLQPQVIVGGADEYFPSLALYMDALMQKLHTVTYAEEYQIYSKDAQGFVPGEGACMLLLEDPHAANARGADVLAIIAGYGKACSNVYFDATRVSERAAALALAIARALSDAGVTAKDIALICGSSNGNKDDSWVEINAILSLFQQENPHVPVVNYNACFGFVAATAGLLNLAIVIDCIRKQAVAPVPYTCEFFDSRINFVRQPQKIKINYALLIGATEGGNYYAFVIKGT